MPFPRPTLTSLQNQGLQDVINYHIPGQTALLRRSPLRALVIANSGLVWGNYQYLDYIAQQSIPFTATGENLLAWGGLVNVLPNPAIAATDGTVTFFGTTGAVIPAGTQLTTLDGIRFVTKQSGTIQQTGNSNLNAGTQGINAECLSVGKNGNLPAGAALTIVNPIGGVTSQATVNTTFTSGTDIEDEELYRTRVLFAFRNPPQGGSLADYADWALQVPGVTRAWALNGELGAGDLYVYFMADIVNAPNNGFPIGLDGVSTYEQRFPPNTTTFAINGNANSVMVTATGDQKTVADYIYPLREATAYVIVKSPTPSTVNFTFSSFYPPDQVVFNAAYQQLQAYFARVGTPYGVTQTAPGTDDQTGTIYESDYFAALEQTPGLVNFSLSSPLGNLVTQAGQLPIAGVMTPPPNVGLLPVGLSSGNVNSGTGNVGSGGNTGGAVTPPVTVVPPTPGQITVCTQFVVSDPSTQIGIQWVPPSYTGTDVLTYAVVYTFDSVTFTTLQKSTATFATLTNIPPLTPVGFIINAVTGNNIVGPQSPQFVFQTQAGSSLGGTGGTTTGAIAPSAPQSFAASNMGLGSATFTWLAPATGTGPFTYSVYYSSANLQASGAQLVGQYNLLATTQNTFLNLTGWQTDIDDTISFYVIAQNVNAVPSVPSQGVTLITGVTGGFASLGTFVLL